MLYRVQDNFLNLVAPVGYSPAGNLQPLISIDHMSRLITEIKINHTD